MRLATVLLLGLSCSSLVVACSSSDGTSADAPSSSPAPASDGDGASSDGGARPDDGSGSGRSADGGDGGGGGGKTPTDQGSIPKAFVISGTASVTCTFQSFAEPHVARCKLTPQSTSVTPSVPGAFTGYFSAASTTGQELGAQPGLVVTTPSTNGCLQHLAIGPTYVDYQVASKTPTGEPCNLPADGFTTSGFGPKLEAVIPHALYYPAGVASAIGYDVKVTLSLGIVAPGP